MSTEILVLILSVLIAVLSQVSDYFITHPDELGE
ncbi:hypothetical protein QIS17_gp4 [ssRNA phage SRR7976299_17]|uniref:Uncharacterized protein n=1 Tax=ssRNA phage SRR7976299_17 TaxID=2786639 RepID=A0A8S5L5H6_9VIRU|nr:hypothetical protein QIS17_gp4 [ssRNA phage SRR7976299_17]DAD52647.1 TPA_asm: hypothetical protein [ssRNA phage SRR7976299_17]